MKRLIVGCLSLVKRIIMFGVNLLRNTYYRLTVKHVKYNVEEIFMQQNSSKGYNRLDTVVRYLAVEEYYGKNDYGFRLYEKMQGKRIDKEYVAGSVERFRSLIESWDKNGYTDASEISLDSNLFLIDGSHRMALALYHGIKDISCKVYGNKTSTEYGVSWFVQNDFTLEEIKIIQNKCDELLAKHKQSISVILWPPVQNYFEEITEKIRVLYQVGDVQDFQYTDETFKRIVKGIYYIDDIADWKINKKIEYMSGFEPKKVRVMQLYLDCPGFRRKASNQNTLSREGEKIKSIIRKCYAEKIDNYFYDIIIHTGDNYKQSEFINQLFKAEIPLSGFFDLIRNNTWMLIKSENEYTPENFPEEFPFSKDADMICAEAEFEKLKETAYSFFEANIKAIYRLRKIEEKKRVKIRIEQEGFLIYQIDLACEVDGLKKKFVEESLGRRKKVKNYYITDEIDEVYYRMNEYNHYPEKKRHLDYVEKHRDLYDEEKMKQIQI